MRAEFERKMAEKIAETRNEMRAKSETRRTNLECENGKENRGRNDRNRNEFRKRRCSRSPQVCHSVTFINFPLNNSDMTYLLT